MKYRTLGETGLTVSEIGFGTWGIGGLSSGASSYGPTDDAESRRALRTAVDHGITFYDTADVYGSGHSEELIGETLRDVRHRIVIASKVGFLDHYGPQDFSPGYIRRSLEGSLRRLGTDYIDLYQLHSPVIDALVAADSVLATLRTLREEGKIRAFGISVRVPADGPIAVDRLGYRAVQVNFSMVDQRARENGLFDVAQQRRAGIICRTPLVYGFLAGEYSAERAFDPRDHRSTWSAEQRRVWASAHTRFPWPRSGGGNQTRAQVALRFCLSYGCVSTVIPGMLTVAQVVENTTASDLGALDDGEVRDTERIYAENTFFVGGRPVTAAGDAARR